jgi:hypothetical protein
MAFINMSDDEKDLYLDVLREGTTPFDRFVARGKMEDTIDIPGPRRKIDRFLFRGVRQTQSDSSTRLIPILGSAGSGKTHAYWAYKTIERKMAHPESEAAQDLPDNLPTNWTIVYVPSPPAAVRILLHVYTCLLDELKSDILRSVSEKLIARWGGFKKKKLGLFGGQDLDETIQNGIREYPGIFADCVKCLCIFALDKDRTGLAERWLLGEDLAEEDLDKLAIDNVIESDDICLAMIKLICEYSDKTIILYFDELESPYRMHGPEAETKFLETLKRLYNEIKNVIIVIAVLKEIWPRILETADQALRSRMESERELEYFKFDDLLLYFAKAMEFFWAQNNLNPPIYPLFPINEAILKIIFDKTDGNQRSIIKLIRLFIDKITLDEMTLDEVISDSKAAPEVAAPAATAAGGAAAAAPTKKEKSIIEQIEDMMADEEYNIEANPASVAGAALKSIKVIAEKFSKEIKIDLAFKFLVGKRSYSLAGMVEFGGKKHGLEIPSVKTFNRSGGVAAFYAAKRLSQAISTQAIDIGLLIVPEGTGGAKYKSLIAHAKGNLMVFEFNEDSAKYLIAQAIKQPSQEAYDICVKMMGDLPDYEVPIPPYANKDEEESDDESAEASSEESSETESAEAPAASDESSSEPPSSDS